MKCKNNSGFTLVELMIVSALLAILAGIAIPAYNGYVINSRKSECLFELSSIKLAQEEFYLENNSYYTGVLDGSTSTLTNAFYQNNSSAADRNCTYAVTAGTTGSIATSFTITATGTNKLAGEGVISTYNSQ